MSERDLLIGQLLVNAGLINVRHLEDALSRQKASGGFLCSLLVKNGAADKDKVFSFLSRQLSIPFINLKATTPDPEAIKRVPAKIACHYKIAPIEFSGQVLSLAMSDPLDIRTLDDLELFLDVKVKGLLAYEEDILDAIRKIYGIGAATIEKMMDRQPAVVETKTQTAAGEQGTDANDASVTKFVDQIMREAVKDRASDIHLEPFENGVRTRFRIDGVLYDVNTPESVKYFYPAIVSRIKIMSNLNIAEKRLPQDGRIKLNVNNDELDLRVSILPSVYGEAVQVRVLSTQFFLELEKLGLLDQDLKLLEQLITKPHGVIFLTGPTGSGKSTTLYACLSRLNSPGTKIITIEDPVEYQLNGIIQMQVQPKIGFDFAAGLRHTLRHDPDVIMVGEARDFATAEIAIRSALTGHLVFSTLHTNDAAGTVTRLLDMGVEPFLVSSSCECFIAQRLVRLI
jgi:type IV pilus assembly protein PilB